MKEFTFELSTKIYFGTNIWKEALQKEKARLIGNIMIITTGRSLVKHGYQQLIQQAIVEIIGNNKIYIYDKISQNPKLEEVKQAIEIGKERSIDCVIGFGGGSAIDAAKAVAVGIPVEEPIETYLLEGKEPRKETLPIIAIPTTAGTGTELSKGAIISSTYHRIKTGIRGKNILPKIAIVDDMFTWTVPEKITMETGFDVLAHAIESYVAVKANPFSEMISEKAIQIVGHNLSLLKQDLDNHEARSQMCYASMIVGMNLANVGTCLPHRMQYSIGAYTDTSHGAGLLALYPAWIKYEYEVNQEKINQILNGLGYSKVKSAEEAENMFKVFLNKLDILYLLSDLGIQEQMLDELSGQVTGNLSNDKLSEESDIIKKIFKKAMEN
ncbi:MAG: iron-containing alcohol dehydrogenase [Lachnospiraceae bacterium]|nr:iron-containing alcohol dehydrogenase [Lachnospiraceae bacterium]